MKYKSVSDKGKKYDNFATLRKYESMLRNYEECGTIHKNNTINKNEFVITDEMYEELKTKLYMCGMGTIEEFLGVNERILNFI